MSTPVSPARMGATSPWTRALPFVAALCTAALLGVCGGLLLAPQRATGPRPGPVDIGFAQDMTAHHRQAVTMAGLELRHGADPQIRQFARDLQHTALDQIGRMHGWLTLWNRLPAPAGPRMTWMPARGSDTSDRAQHENSDESARPAGTSVTEHAPAMPGMATPADMRRLRQLRGDALDTAFLRLMLRHHQGGLPLSGYAAQHASLPQVSNLAGAMRLTQSAEVDSMQRMLADRDAAPLPPP